MNPNPKPDSTTTALEFFDRVLPRQGQYMAFELPSRQHHVFHTTAELADFVDGFDAGEIYHACASYRSGQSRKAENVQALRSFWLDLDCGPTKDYPDQESALRALIGLCRATKLPRPIVLDSGGGLHLYWPLTADVTPKDWKPVAAALKALCEAHGLLADRNVTTDTARILRPPGTLNRKYSPPPTVKVVGDAAPVDFSAFKSVVEAAAGKIRPDSTMSEIKKASAQIINLHGLTLDTNRRMIGEAANWPATPENIARVRSYLDAVPADADYDRWRDCVWAVASLDWGNTGRGLVEDWSRQSGDHWKDGGHEAGKKIRQLMDDYDPSQGITIGTLIHHARQHGYTEASGVVGTPSSATIIQPTQARESQFYSAASLKGKAVPPRQWLVQGLVPQKTVTLFSGDGGTGKSLLALQLAVAVAAQTAWIGKTANTGRVIFLSAEDDDDELHRRLDDILTAEGRDYDDLSGLTLRSLAGEDALLAVETQIALMQSALFEELDKRAAEEAPALIVIDTLADVYPANENDRAKVRQFVGILRGLAIKRKCAVLLLGHPSLTGLNSGTGTSGSTAWNNSVRSRLYLSRITDNGFEPDPDARVLSTKKANYGRTGGEINLKWEAGVFVAETQPSGLDALAAGTKGERVFLKLLDTLTAQGRYVSANPGPTYAPAQFASHPEAEGCTKRALKSAMDALFGRGEIVSARHGSGAKARSHIARKGADHGQE